jgi:hypothetical protein
MEYSVRNIEYNDYETLLEWWKYWRFPAPTRGILPNNGLDGLVIEYNNIPICAGFLYATSSKELFWIEFIISNFNIKDKVIRETSIRLLIQYLEKMAVEMGAKAIFTTLKNQNLVKHYAYCGFNKAGENNIEMIKTYY